MGEGGTNWAGNVTYSAGRLHSPRTVEEVRALVRGAQKLKVLGARHSFTDVADSEETLLSLDAMEPVFILDRQRHTATVNAGVRYGELCRRLHREGYAIHNTASLPHISLAGACATGTHGSGDRNGSLATAVSGLELVTAGGDRRTLTRERDEEDFPGAVVALGALGVVTTLTLDLLPAFEMRQEVYEGLPLVQLEAHLAEVLSAAYSVSLFTDWQGEQISQVWLKRRIEEGATPGPDFFGATPAPGPRHPLAGRSPAACTAQLGEPGPWYDRLPHFRQEATPSAGQELQSEYLLPRRHAVAALRALTGMRAHLAPLLQISEVRTVAADDLWLSPSYGQDSVALHFTWQPDGEGVRRLLPLLEQRLDPLDARPHWGKLFATPAARLVALYPRLPDFRRLSQRYDPQGTFRNPFLERHLFGGEGGGSTPPV
jgi:xylitol oxidase